MSAPDRREIAEGFRYAHFRADANTGRLLDVAATITATLDLLQERGLLDPSELEQRKAAAVESLKERFADRGMGVMYQHPERDKYSFPLETPIDCEARVHLCKAACCRLPFALSRQDVEEGVVRWDFSRPYVIAHDADGCCHHLDRSKRCCSIYTQRPVPCRGYDCRNDRRIWSDFQRRIPNPRLDEPDWWKSEDGREGNR